jgi:hypothetical protein
MGKKKFAVLLLGLLVCFFVGGYTGMFLTKRSLTESGGPPGVTVDTLVYTDTVIFQAPSLAGVTLAGIRTVTLPLPLVMTASEAEDTAEGLHRCLDGCGSGGEPRCCTAWPDSVTVEVETVQKHYEDSLYEAWLSGPGWAELDSVKVRAPTRVVTVTRTVNGTRRKRRGIGLQAGAGLTGRGSAEPYLGVGVTYQLIGL